MTAPQPEVPVSGAAAAVTLRSRRSIRLSSFAIAGRLVLAQLIVGAASLIINALAARSMGLDGRGMLALLLQVTYLANMLAVAGTDRSYPATVPIGRSVRGTSADTLRLMAPSAVAVLLIAAPIVHTIGGRWSGGGLLTVAAFALTTIVLVATASLRTGAAASGDVRPYVTATFTAQILLVAATTVLTVAGTDSPTIWLLVYGLALGSGPALAWMILRRRPFELEPTHGLSPARRLGLRLLPAAVASMVMLRADRLLLPWLGSYDQLGLYIVVATVAEFAIWPVQSWIDAQSPRWHQQFLAGELRRAGPLLGAAAYGVAAALALLLAGNLLVVPVFGAEFRDSVQLLPPLAAGTVCYAISRVAIGLSVAATQARGAIAADVPAMIVALAAYIVLIPRYGAMGAAMGSAGAYALGAILAVALLRASTAVPTVPAPTAEPNVDDLR